MLKEKEKNNLQKAIRKRTQWLSGRSCVQEAYIMFMGSHNNIEALVLLSAADVESKPELSTLTWVCQGPKIDRH